MWFWQKTGQWIEYKINGENTKISFNEEEKFLE